MESFVRGVHTQANPDLVRNILGRDSANFVDVIHTNAGKEVCIGCVKSRQLNCTKCFIPKIVSVRSGTFQPLGHMDFYPDGAGLQQGCVEQADPDHPDDGGRRRRGGEETASNL